MIRLYRDRLQELCRVECVQSPPYHIRQIKFLGSTRFPNYSRHVWKKNLGVEPACVNVTTDCAPLLDTTTSGPIPRFNGSTRLTFYKLSLLDEIICGVGHPWLNAIPVVHTTFDPCPRSQIITYARVNTVLGSLR